MPINIDGNGSIGGLVAGGLPDATVQTADLVDASVTPTKLSQPMTLMTAQNATGTSIDFTGIPNWVKRITVMFSGVSTNGTSALMLQLGVGSVATTGYTSHAAAINNGTGQVGSTSGHVINVALPAGTTNSGSVTFFLQSNFVYVGTGVSLYTAAAGAMAMSASRVSFASPIDRVRITTANGTDTFNAGSINVMYEG